MNIYFGENIKRLRTEHDMTQETLARFLGVSFQTVSKWERGETYPDISMLPIIANFFNTTTDSLLGVSQLNKEKKIKEYLEFYDRMMFKDSTLAFRKFINAAKDFPGEYSILVRYMELLIVEKTGQDEPDYEKTSNELMSIYKNIQNYCTDDSIRMWSKRLICQHLHTKSYYTGVDSYQEQAEAILQEMPEMINTGEYLSTMLLSDKYKHFTACSNAIEQTLYILVNVINHYCYYDDSFSPQYKIEAMKKVNTVLSTIFTDGNYGKLWLGLICNCGHLGHLYFEIGDTASALKYLKLSAEYAVKYDALPQESERTAQFFEDKAYRKPDSEKTMCERIKNSMLNVFPLSDSFKATNEFKEIIDLLGS